MPHTLCNLRKGYHAVFEEKKCIRGGGCSATVKNWHSVLLAQKKENKKLTFTGIPGNTKNVAQGMQASGGVFQWRRFDETRGMAYQKHHYPDRGLQQDRMVQRWSLDTTVSWNDFQKSVAFVVSRKHLLFSVECNYQPIGIDCHDRVSPNSTIFGPFAADINWTIDCC